MAPSKDLFADLFDDFKSGGEKAASQTPETKVKHSGTALTPLKKGRVSQHNSSTAVKNHLDDVFGFPTVSSANNVPTANMTSDVADLLMSGFEELKMEQKPQVCEQDFGIKQSHDGFGHSPKTENRYNDSQSSNRHIDTQDPNRYNDTNHSNRYSNTNHSNRYNDSQNPNRYNDSHYSNRYTDINHSNMYTDSQNPNRYNDTQHSKRYTDTNIPKRNSGGRARNAASRTELAESSTAELRDASGRNTSNFSSVTAQLFEQGRKFFESQFSFDTSDRMSASEPSRSLSERTSRQDRFAEFSSQNNLVKSQNNLLSGQNDLLSGQNDLVKSQNGLLSGQNDLLSSKNDLLSSQNDLLSSQNDLLSNIAPSELNQSSAFTTTDSLLSFNDTTPAKEPQSASSTSLLFDLDEPVLPKQSLTRPAVSVSTSLNTNISIPAALTTTISSFERDSYYEFKDQGTAAFKLGNFQKAAEKFKQTSQAIPRNHIFQIVIYRNLITTYLKIGDTSVLEDMFNHVFAFLPQESFKQWANYEFTERKVLKLKDLFKKILVCQCDYLELKENQREALNVYKRMLDFGFSDREILKEKQRLEKMVNPPKKAVATNATTNVAAAKVTTNVVAPKTVPAAQTSKAKPKAVNDDTIAEIKKQVNSKIERWCGGKEKDLRYLLSTLQQVVPDWAPLEMQTLISPKKCKIYYFKAINRTHPDKIPQDSGRDVQVLLETVFMVLNRAWDGFRAENGL